MNWSLTLPLGYPYFLRDVNMKETYDMYIKFIIFSRINSVTK